MRRSAWRYAVGVVLAAAVLTALPRTVTAHATTGGATTGATPNHVRVTLVTGDRVLVRVAGAAVRFVAVEPGRGRKGVTFRHRTEHGDEYVIPGDAANLVRRNRVDRRLFDISLLVRSRYDDRSRTTLPLILTGQATAGVRAGRSLSSVDGRATELRKADAAGFWASATAGKAKGLTAGTGRIWLDGKVAATLDRSKAAGTALPVLAVRFAPALDDHNLARAGKPARYSVTVQRGAGASYGDLTTLTVEASYDDGRTWTPDRVTGTGLARTVTVDHPAGARFVSLRATAADDRDTAVTETLIRAYGLR